MSFKAVAWAWDQKPGGPPGRKWVLTGIAQYADENGFCFPSQPKLADRVGMSLRALRDHLDDLEAAGYIQRKRRFRPDGTRTTDAIWLNLSLPAAKFPLEETHCGPSICEEFGADDLDNQPADFASGKKQPPAVSASGKKGVLPPAENAGHEPVIEPIKNKKKVNARASALRFDPETGKFSGITPELTQIWSDAYPALDLLREINRAGAWLIANPANTKSNYKRYLTNWLARAQDRAPRAASNRGNSHPTDWAQERADTIAGLTGRKPTYERTDDAFDVEARLVG